MVELRLKDIVVCKKGRFSIGVEESSGKFYVSIPVSNSRVDYEEYYEIDEATFARYQADLHAALDFAERCRRRDADELLMFDPGKDRGVPR